MKSFGSPLAWPLLLLVLVTAVPDSQAAAPDAGGELPFEVSGDIMPGEASGDVVEAHGHVKVTRGAFTLTADHVRYEKKSDSALATGEVRVRQNDYTLTCRRLRFHVGRELAIAWDEPVLARPAPLDPGARAGREEIELRATQITLDISSDRVVGLDRAELTRWIAAPGGRTLDIRVRAGEIELDQVARSCTFRDGVRIESPQLGATARRALLEEPLDRLTLVGDAEAWGIGADGQSADRVSGQKILHFLRGNRTLVFGAVQGRMKLGR